jgi:uncharacterized protein YodC (DUF2158 family)
VNQINAGDVVQLKSGGPEMTVSNLHQWQGRTEANCEWFEGSKNHSNSFPLTSLKLVTNRDSVSGGSGAEATGDPSTAWMR